MGSAEAGVEAERKKAMRGSRSGQAAVDSSSRAAIREQNLLR
jgi:hypothetical protein